MAITTNQITITTMEGWYSGATPPLNPLIGDLWLDTTSNEIKKYDGTNWIKQADTQGPQGPKGDSMVSREAYWIKSSISPDPPDPETEDMKGWIKGSEPPESQLNNIGETDKFWRTYKETYSNGDVVYSKVELIGSYEVLKGVVQFREGVTAKENGITVIDGGKILSKSIQADKIKVEDLETLKATIGGFHIGKTSIYSGNKDSISSVEKGIYFDSNGQSYFGDNKNYIRFYQSADNKYKLKISADSLEFSSGVSVDAEIDNASKTATDFIVPQTTNLTDDGIKIFPKAEKDNPQNYSQINQDGMQIYKGGKKTASFGSEKISLGENSEQSILEMCGGLTSLNSEVTQNAAGDKIGYILLSPTPLAQGKNYPFECGIASTNRDAMVLIGNSSFSLGSDAKSGIPSINYIASQLSGYSEFDANEEYPEDGPYAYTSIGMHAGMGMSDGSEPAAGIGMDAHLDNNTGKIKSTMDIYADDLTIDVKNLNLVNSNEQVWSGAWYMSGSQSINIHKTIEQIPNGIVLAFSRYLISNSEVSNTNWHYEFIPKWHVMNSLNPSASAGILMSWTGATQQYSIAKYMYAKINNNGEIVVSGHDNNTAHGTGANGVKYDNRNAVLRAVLIV